MSVINNVLRELENKPSSFTPLDTSGILIHKAEPTRWPLAWFLLISIVAVIMVVLYVLDFNEINMASKLDQSVTTAKEISENYIVEEKPLNEFLQVTGLQINESKDFMELKFQLQGKSNIFLEERNENSYTFHIKNTLSRTPTPVLGENPWLLTLSMKNQDDGLDIHFKTQQGVLVETSSRSDQQQFNWVIKLKKIILQKPEKKKPVATVESPDEQTSLTPERAVLPPEETDAGVESEKPVEVKLEIKSAVSPVTDLQQLKQAMRSYNSSDWMQAESQFLSLIGGKQDRQARLYLIQLYQRLNSDQLEKSIQEGQSKYPEDTAFQLLYANQLFRNKRYQDVIRIFEKKANTLKVINLLAASFQRLGQHENAVFHYLNAIRLDSESSRLWISLGISQQEIGQKKQALKSYQTAQANGPVNDRLKAFLQQRIRLLSKE